ncbi:sodium-dependent bicarbonate transport family permease [Desulfitibacter alkalitolerans]|uniref:sodium-dependent bicarbonate transport family permease n=1 Tax=Desulfitibacter alkalitolerans TaxID=264641 RepID=UPI000487D0A0|nr:sodium-dependent bicarbonate transport family permease [Desulfitibacter alkalitolerans]
MFFQDLIGQIISPPILFFVIGVLAALLRSDLKIPEAAGIIMSIFILASIGLRAGVAVNKAGISDVVLPMLLAVFKGILIAVIVYSILKWITRIDTANAASIAGHYGAVSSATLAVSVVYLDSIGVYYESFVPALYPFMDTAALITAVIVSRIGTAANKTEMIPVAGLVRETIVSKAPLLLLGCFIIGFVNGEAGTKAIMPAFDLMFPGVLTIFMLDVGLIAGSRLSDLRKVDKRVFVVGLMLPPIQGLTAIILAKAIGLSPGGATVFAALAAGASYISAPAVMRTAVPTANPALSLALALGLVFPFNVTIGIPLYYQIAQMINVLF